MSARSMIRAREREAIRAQRRSSSRLKRTVGGTAAALGAAVALAPSADAATFQVTNLTDADAGSLRAAVELADADAAADTITFAPGLTGEITLTSGEIEIDAPLDIQGPGAGTLAVDGNDNSRIFKLDAGDVGSPRDVVSISGLTMRDGYASDGGGALYSFQSDMRLANVVLSTNESTGTGGTIDIEQSPVSIIDSTVTGSKSGSGGGVMYTDGANAETNSQDTITIRNSVFSGSYASGDGGVFYFDNATGGDILIAGSELRGNESTGTGGAIEFYGHKGSQTIRSSTISGNTADRDGGAIYFNSDYDDPDGLLIENSTISDNFSGAQGGGISLENYDGKPVRILNSTVANNTSTGPGGGIYRNDYDVTLSSTIVAGNNSTSGDEDDLAQNASATEQFTAGFSLVEGGFANVTVTETPAGSNQTGVDPDLGPLADNGGATRTHLPSKTSSVVDAGIANGLATDQRGLARKVDRPENTNAAGSDGTDIGAVEVALEPVVPPPDTTVDDAETSIKKTQKQKGKKIKVTLDVSAGEAVDVLATGKVKAGKKSYGLKQAATDLTAGETETLTLKPNGKKATKKIVKFLAKGKKAKANLTAVFTDAAGNEVTDTAKAKLKGKKKK